jgi:ABC-type polysaccharide/polyol phosphate transport system ATPase subunit
MPHDGISTRPGDKLRYRILHAGRVSTSELPPLQLLDAVAPDGVAIGIIGGDGAGKSMLLPWLALISVAGHSSNKNSRLCLKNQIFSPSRPSAREGTLDLL